MGGLKGEKVVGLGRVGVLVVGLLLDGWVAGWMDEWMAGWMNGWRGRLFCRLIWTVGMLWMFCTVLHFCEASNH